MPDDYTGDPDATQAPASAPAAGSFPVVSLPIDADPANASAHHQPLKVLADYIAYLQNHVGGGSAVVGHGGDGDVTVSGPLTLLRNMYYNNLTVAATGEINTNGYVVFVRGTLEFESGGHIQNNGAAATTRIGATAPGSNRLLGGGDGGDGRNGGITGPTAGSAPADGTLFVADKFGGAGGAGGGGGSGAAGGSVGFPINEIGDFGPFQPGFAFIGASSPYALAGGAGGGGGHGPVGQGGGGGSGAGVVALVVNRLKLSSSSDIRANGGDGADGQSDPGDCGGGGGGGGCVVVWRVSNDNAVTPVGEALGGAGGSGISPGTAGADGPAGQVFELAL